MISPRTGGIPPTDGPLSKVPASPAAESTRWQLVGTFRTLESAEAVVRRLAEQQIESSICMIDGLSVIARR